MDENALDDLRARVHRLEDESAIRRLIMSYGPAADAALASFAGRLWLEDGVYDLGRDLIGVEGDCATAVNYSLIMRREEDRHYLWRVSAVRWDVERTGSSWRVRRRTNRLLDASGAGSLGNSPFFTTAEHLSNWRSD